MHRYPSKISVLDVQLQNLVPAFPADQAGGWAWNFGGAGGGGGGGGIVGGGGGRSGSASGVRTSWTQRATLPNIIRSKDIKIFSLPKNT